MTMIPSIRGVQTTGSYTLLQVYLRLVRMWAVIIDPLHFVLKCVFGALLRRYVI